MTLSLCNMLWHGGQELETSSTAQLDHVNSKLKETEEALIKEKHAHNETRALLSHTKEVGEDIT